MVPLAFTVLPIEISLVLPLVMSERLPVAFNIPQKINMYYIVALLLLLLYYNRNFSGLTKRILLPQTMKTAETSVRIKTGFVCLVPKDGSGNDRCYNAPLPCTPYLKADLEMRGKDLSEGFRIGH